MKAKELSPAFRHAHASGRAKGDTMEAHQRRLAYKREWQKRRAQYWRQLKEKQTQPKEHRK